MKSISIPCSRELTHEVSSCVSCHSSVRQEENITTESLENMTSKIELDNLKTLKSPHYKATYVQLGKIGLLHINKTLIHFKTMKHASIREMDRGSHTWHNTEFGISHSLTQRRNAVSETIPMRHISLHEHNLQTVVQRNNLRLIQPEMMRRSDE